jgi:PAS domain-containing protein
VGAPRFDVQAVMEVVWRADGTSFPVEYWSYPIRDNNVLIGAVVTFVDITERKRAEHALQQSAEMFRQLMESIQKRGSRMFGNKPTGQLMSLLDN